MTFLLNQKLSTDAFARTRTSEPETLFDSKQIHDNLPLLFDDAEVSGSGTTSTYSADKANSIMGVALNTAGNRTRQTFRAFNYQPGKSQLILMTGNLGLSGGGSGIEAGMGYIDDDNGIALVNKDGVPNVRLRSKITGSAVDTDVAQSSWNVDTMDGTGPSGITLDITKSQIFMIDFEWLAVGTVSFCLVIDKKIHAIHNMHHANTIDGAYMSMPNLPLRWWIDNDGTGAASTMSHICGTVVSEGGHNPNGIPQYVSTAESDTASTEISANTANTIYAVVGIKIKDAFAGVDMRVTNVSMISETADDFEWLLLHNPTVTGTFTFSDRTNSLMQTAKGSTATVTGGHKIAGGYSRAEGNIHVDLMSNLSLGKSIAGVEDELVLCVRPLTANADVQGSISWLEF